jgi:hypothetical protein
MRLSASNFNFYWWSLNFVQKCSILSIKNGNDNVRIEDNCLEEELATTPILSEIRTLSLTFVMLMRFFARLNIYYKTFLTIKKKIECNAIRRPSHRVATMSIFVSRFQGNMQTTTAIAVFVRKYRQLC